MACFLRLAFAALILPVASSADAQPRNDEENLQRAVALFEESEDLYNEGSFAEAAALLREAYSLRPDPVLLFNLGRALEGMGDLGGAIEAYEGYLDGAPDARDRGAIERRVETLREQQAQMTTTQDGGGASGAAFEPLPALPDSEERLTDDGAASPVPWVVAGLGAGILVAGAVAGVMSKGREEDAASARVQRTAQELHDEAGTLAIIANVGFVAGGVLLATGLTWGVLSLSGGSDDEVATVLTLGPTSLSLAGRF